MKWSYIRWIYRWFPELGWLRLYVWIVWEIPFIQGDSSRDLFIPYLELRCLGKPKGRSSKGMTGRPRPCLCVKFQPLDMFFWWTSVTNFTAQLEDSGNYENPCEPATLSCESDGWFFLPGLPEMELSAFAKPRWSKNPLSRLATCKSFPPLSTKVVEFVQDLF